MSGELIPEVVIRYGTARQQEIARLYNELGGTAKVAENTGIAQRTVRDNLQRLREKAARKGCSPEHNFDHPAPEGFFTQRVSTYRDGDGDVRGQWTVQVPGKEAQWAQYQEMMESIAERYTGHLQPVECSRSDLSDDLLSVYPLGDPHMGLYASARVSGAAFDCEIARHNLLAATDDLCSRAPKSKTALIINVGDGWHADNGTARTPKGGNVLDVDGRIEDVLEIGCDASVRLAQRVAAQHEKVIYYVAVGNHDPYTTLWHRKYLEAMFSNNPHVEVVTDPRMFWYYQFGRVLLGVTHGDGCKPNDLGEIMAADAKEMWGQTDHHIWHTGHIHHDSVKDGRDWRFESHRTLAPNDKWHHGRGYRSKQSMSCIVYHKTHGEMTRNTVGISLLQEKV